MNRFTEYMFRIRRFVPAGSNSGAITVEYALCMIVAAFIMLGVFTLFEDMSVKLITEFKQYVINFPNT